MPAEFEHRHVTANGIDFHVATTGPTSGPPVLLIHGAQDPIVPFADSALGLLRTLPDVRAHVFGRCRHSSPLEYTDDFNQLVLSFLETHR